MQSPQLKESAIEDLLASGLSVSGRYAVRSSNHRNFLKATIPVQAPDGCPFLIEMRVNVNDTIRDKASFTLVVNGISIRRLCLNGNHGNRHTNDEVWHSRTHKHRYTDVCADRFAYTPTDITEESLNGVFRQFCGECNIACDATLADLPAPRLFHVDDV